MDENQKSKSKNVYKIIMLIILTAFITFMVTSLSLYSYYTNKPAYTLITDSSSADTSELDSYLNSIDKLISKYYLWSDKIDQNKLKEGAISGYVSGLGDEYTEYIPASEMEKFTENITGSFVGIGIYMIADEENDQIIVYYPIPNSPAEKAGIKSGDIIKSVDGIEYGYDDFDVIASKIKGIDGTEVTLVVERKGKEITFKVKREKIELNPITSKILDNNIGYIKLPSFDEKSSDHFKEKVDDLVSQGATSLIIDLRNNGGGIVDESTTIANYFLDKGKTIMTTKDKNGNEEITKAEKDKIYNMPVVVLVNENSASASEILTAALKDNKRAKIVGNTTYGKGVIQTVLTLTDGSGLKITTAEYFTPSGTEIHKKGIDPDIKVELPKSITNIYSVSEDDDTQLQKAISELSK